MRTASALIIGAAALLQFDGFASAETCASYVDYSDGSSLCGPTGVLTSDLPADITCADPLVCTFAECCQPETCDSNYNTDDDCNETGDVLGNAADKTTLACTADGGATCAFTDCCNPRMCTEYTVDGVIGTQTKCPNGDKNGDNSGIPCVDGVCTFDVCCAPEICDNWDGHANNGGATGCADASRTPLADGTACAAEKCTLNDCCTPTCATGKLDGSGDPFECTLDFQALDPAKLNFDCGDATDGGSNLICENSECCALGTAYCGDGSFTCSVVGEAVPAAYFATVCENECDDTQCGCALAAVTCRQELHSCSAGARIDANSCPDGIGTCTDALCCTSETESTITESRMMRTPRSRMGMSQYGA